MNASRRDVLKGIALGTAAAAAPVATTEAARRLGLVDGTRPWWLLKPWARGSSLALGWYLEDVSPVRKGASILSLAHASGAKARIHLCLHDGNPRGIAHSALVDLVLMNGSAGRSRTPESLGRVVLGIAERIAENETDPDGDLWPLAQMLTHEQRVASYGPQLEETTTG